MQVDCANLILEAVELVSAEPAAAPSACRGRENSSKACATSPGGSPRSSEEAGRVPLARRLELPDIGSGSSPSTSPRRRRAGAPWRRCSNRATRRSTGCGDAWPRGSATGRSASIIPSRGSPPRDRREPTRDRPTSLLASPPSRRTTTERYTGETANGFRHSARPAGYLDSRSLHRGRDRASRRAETASASSTIAVRTRTNWKKAAGGRGVGGAPRRGERRADEPSRYRTQPAERRDGTNLGMAVIRSTSRASSASATCRREHRSSALQWGSCSCSTRSRGELQLEDAAKGAASRGSPKRPTPVQLHGDERSGQRGADPEREELEHRIHNATLRRWWLERRRPGDGVASAFLVPTDRSTGSRSCSDPAMPTDHGRFTMKDVRVLARRSSGRGGGSGRPAFLQRTGLSGRLPPGRPVLHRRVRRVPARATFGPGDEPGDRFQLVASDPVRDVRAGPEQPRDGSIRRFGLGQGLDVQLLVEPALLRGGGSRQVHGLGYRGTSPSSTSIPTALSDHRRAEGGTPRRGLSLFMTARAEELPEDLASLRREVRAPSSPASKPAGDRSRR